MGRWPGAAAGVVLALGLWTGCGPAPAGGREPSLLDASFRLTSLPPEPDDVTDVQASARPGDPVALRGVAAGFVEGLAAFVLADRRLPDCTRGGALAGCPTPWDFCCVDPEERRRAMLTVEFRDGEQVLPCRLAGFDGLDHLSQVIVTGRVERDSAGNVIVVASGLAVPGR